MLNAPFELRFMNPLFINHSFIGWKDYSLTSLERRYYAEGHFGAYLCFNAEYIPTPNLRIYAYYSQNEIMDPGWEHHEWDYAYPDSLGGQLGVEYLLPLIRIIVNLQACTGLGKILIRNISGCAITDGTFLLPSISLNQKKKNLKLC